MHEDLAIAIAVIVAAGVCAQWLASWFQIPSVLILLPAGILVGPVTGVVEPEVLFGDALFSVIAIAVGLILFEGGLGLQLSSVRTVGRPVIGLVSIGVAITWVAGGLASMWLFDLSPRVGFLLGAILVVSGPTVVLPLLASVRLRDPIGPILRWECIAIDPIGAVLAVAVFEAIVDSHTGFNPLSVLLGSAAVGVGAGVVAGFSLAWLFKMHLVPDRLHNPLTLAMVIGCFVAANTLSVEAGLFATTVMGVVVANQRFAPVAHIAAFGEDLGVLLLGGLFVVLGATIEFGAMRSVLLPSIALLAVLIAVRPVAVWFSTIGVKLSTRERAYLSLIAPRGVVAASVAALFSVSLEREGVEGASQLAPAAFCVIIGSVAFASLVARPASHRLRVASAGSTGILLAGDEPWLLDAAAALTASDVPVLVVHVDGASDQAADRGVLTYQGPLDGEELVDAINLVGVGEAVVAVPSASTSAFLVEHLSELLGRRNVFTVVAGNHQRGTFARAWGRRAFGGMLDAPRQTDAPHWDIRVVPAAQEEANGNIPLFFLADGEPAMVASGRRVPRSAASMVVASGR